MKQTVKKTDELKNLQESIKRLGIYRIFKDFDSGYDIKRLAVEDWKDKSGALYWEYLGHVKSHRRARKMIAALEGMVE